MYALYIDHQLSLMYDTELKKKKKGGLGPEPFQ